MTLADRLRHALARVAAADLLLLPGDMPDDQGEDGDTPAAVLVAVTDRPDPGVLLTMRTDTLSRHAGQVAFPGGRADPGDADSTATALREAHEEIGLDPAAVEVVGAVDRYRTVTGFTVTPVLGVIAPDLVLVAQPREVQAIFEVPLAFLLDPANHARGRAEFRGRERHFYDMQWREHRIWGATAAMIVNLSRRLSWPI